MEEMINNPIASSDLHETLKETFRLLLRDLILSLRRQHLQAGGNPMTHWDRIQAVLQSQARQTSSVREWMGRVMRRLQIVSPSSSTSSRASALLSQMDSLSFMLASQRERFVLSLILEEGAYLMAMARVWADEKKALYADKKEQEPEDAAAPKDTHEGILKLMALAAQYGGAK